MLAAPDAIDNAIHPPFEFFRVPDDKTVSDNGGQAPFATRHLLTLANPLPSALLTYIRLDRMVGDNIALYRKRAAKTGKALHDLVRIDDPADPILEVLSLGALRDVLVDMRSGYATSGAEDRARLASGASDLGERLWCALTLRVSEKEIIAAALQAIDMRLAPQLSALVADATAQEAACRKSGQVWAAMQARRSAVLEQCNARIHRTFERLHTCRLGEGELTAAYLAQSCTLFFLLLGNLAAHPLAQHSMWLTHVGPWDSETTNAADAARVDASPPLVSRLPPLGAMMLCCDGQGDQGLAYLKLYKSKMSFWGAYLLSQWGVARTISTVECGTMQQEAEAIRSQHSWSVPTNAALTTICRHTTMILELGAGNGHWANLLRKRGADVLAYDTRCWSEGYCSDVDARSTVASDRSAASERSGAVLMGEREEGVQEGGPEVARAHADRALLLGWPDYLGQGAYSSACLEAYTGDTLVLLGEWHGGTFGAYKAGLNEHGQAFALAFQREVEAKFELVAHEPLPSWPYVVDALRIWKRKK